MPDNRKVAGGHILAEVFGIVAEAKARNETLSTGKHAARLLKAFPDACWSIGHIIDELAAEAALQGVAVEINRTK